VIDNGRIKFTIIPKNLLGDADAAPNQSSFENSPIAILTLETFKIIC